MKHQTRLVPAAVLFFVLCTTVSAGPCGGDSGREGRRGPPSFSALDLDGDGLVTLAEFEQHEIPPPDHRRIFRHIDSDGDGSITESELMNHRPPRRRY